MSQPLHILLPSDVFPPRAGGAGWSAHALARALGQRGHHVAALVPQRGATGIVQRVEDGVRVLDVGYAAPDLPFVANWARFERFWPRFAAAIVQAATGVDRGSLIIHGQHVQGIGAAVLAGEQLGVPVVATVRDHWPHHYFNTALHGDRVPLERFGAAASATDLIARLGPGVGVLSILALPYVLGHLRRRQRVLARCDAVVSLSAYMTRRLLPLVAPDRLHPIPNLVDLAEIDQIVAAPPATVVEGPFVLYAGKLARNKGAHLLPAVLAAFRAAGGAASLVIAGGADPELLAAIRATGVPAQALEWADHAEVLRLLSRCAALVFPSTWGEPLSRVLLEACAVGAPIVAMPTGGTPDLLTDGINARLDPTAAGLGRALAEVVALPHMAARLAEGARHTAETRLAAPVVAAQIEALYRDLIAARAKVA
jgi:glycosyltransferase involved in cell wall biosynthesis